MSVDVKMDSWSPFFGMLAGILMLCLVASTQDEANRFIRLFTGEAKDLVEAGITLARILGTMCGLFFAVAGTCEWFRCLFTNAVNRVVDEREKS